MAKKEKLTMDHTVNMERKRSPEEGFTHEVFDSSLPASRPPRLRSPKHVPTTRGATEGLRYQPACASPALLLLRCHFHRQNLKRERLSCLLSYFSVQTSPAENLSSSEDKLTQTNVPTRAIALQLT